MYLKWTSGDFIKRISLFKRFMRKKEKTKNEYIEKEGAK